MNTKKYGKGVDRAIRIRRGRPGRAFTLVELLVVMSLMALLTSIVLPALHQAGRQARTLACRSQLRQWGLGFSMFLQERDSVILNVASEVWQPFWLPYCDRRPGLFLCPMATRYELNRNDPTWPAQEAVGCGRGSKSTAWKLATRTPATLEPGPLLGSYGVNNLGLLFLESRITRGRRSDCSTIPVFLDGSFYENQATSTDKPPAFDGELTCPEDIKGWCINRHAGGINGLFLDWSVRKIGLKDLWTLNWSPWFDTKNPWTRAGGVQPNDWPLWMRKLKDY